MTEIKSDTALEERWYKRSVALAIVSAIATLITWNRSASAKSELTEYTEHLSGVSGFVEAVVHGVVLDFEYLARVDETVRGMYERYQFWSNAFWICLLVFLCSLAFALWAKRDAIIEFINAS